MSSLHRYKHLTDNDKFDLIRILYHDLKNKSRKTARDYDQLRFLVNEATRLYGRIKQQRSN